MAISATSIGIAPPAARGRADARAVGWWLVAVAAMVFVMVVIGGMTRLTESGLSITEWQPIMGTLPPLSDADWQALFAKYRESPQFQKVFPDLALAGFKEIFWLEYIHRLWGRLIGIVFLVPFLWFWIQGRIPRGYGPALIGLFVLGGLQGAVGWLMVASGLVDRPAVSHYRLAIHLGLAILIYAALLWTAGLIYNSFPLMGEALVPSDYWLPELGWINAFENRAAVQFHHRVLATVTLLAVAYLWWRVRGASAWMLAAVLLQYALGIATILMYGQTPPPMGEAVAIGTLHQAGAMVLVSAAVWLAHAARRASATVTASA
jgi:cytochrome c oxidase assembly protein subunit 15